MKKLLRDPLAHFIVLGAALFLLFDWAGSGAGLDAQRRILVDDEALRTFIQYRSRNYDNATVEQRLRRLSAAEVEDIIKQFVEEEVLYREARRMNLDVQDYVIRRRLVQKLEFIAEGGAAALELQEGDAERHYAQNPEDYYREPSITFAHVYFSQAGRGAAAAGALAERKRDELNRLAAPFTAATRHGDRFIYHVNYVERSPDLVASHFGTAMAAQLFAQPAGAGRWLGPFESEHGFHVVLVADKQPGQLADFSEVAEQAAADARRQLVRERTGAAIQAIVDRYEVQVDLTGLPAAGHP